MPLLVGVLCPFWTHETTRLNKGIQSNGCKKNQFFPKSQKRECRTPQQRACPHRWKDQTMLFLPRFHLPLEMEIFIKRLREVVNINLHMRLRRKFQEKLVRWWPGIYFGSCLPAHVTCVQRGDLAGHIEVVVLWQPFTPNADEPYFLLCAVGTMIF